MGYREPPGDVVTPHLCVILGQTASGKSRLCIELAKRTGGEIISMDALKVYRGMDIGTAKTPESEACGIPHHLTDLVYPDKTFNVSQYLDALESKLAEFRERKVFPIIDCGTPLYLQTFLTGMADGPEPDDELRSELEARASDDLHSELQELDPASAGRLHVNDRKRVIRALEHFKLSGEPISARQTQFAGERRNDWRMLLTSPNWLEEVLRERINLRVERMLEAGLLDEVRRIRNTSGFSKTAGDAIGYRQFLSHLDGEIGYEEAVEQIKRKTWQLARKQLTWFKRHEDVHWLNIRDEVEIDRAAVFLADELAENDHTGSVKIPEDRSSK